MSNLHEILNSRGIGTDAIKSDLASKFYQQYILASNI